MRHVGVAVSARRLRAVLAAPLWALCFGAAHALPGALDTGSFGPTGTRYPADTLRQSKVQNHLALGGDGAIFVAGECNTAASIGSCVRKFRADGVLDAGFAAAGYHHLTVNGYTFTSVAGIALSSRDGTLVVAGTCSNATTAATGSCIVRLDALGNAVPVRAVGGSQTLLFDELLATAFAQLKGGGLTIAGFCRGKSATDSEFCIHTWADGGTSSAGGGPFPDGYWTVDSILARSSGGLWLVNQCKLGAAFYVCLTKFTSPGSIEFTFGSNGTRALNESVAGTPELVTSSASLLQPDDKFLIAGRCRGTGLRPCLKRYNADGSADSTWALASATPNTLQFGVGNEALALAAPRDALAMQGDGKILYATTLAVSPATSPARSDIVVHRLHADGSIDATYGAGGTGRVRINTWGAGVVNSAASGIAVNNSDAAVMLGGCATEAMFGLVQPCLAKLQGGPLDYARCSADIDGDGVIASATDSVLLARVALGFKDAALVQGITFSPSASRTAWLAIRDYLFNQCGMQVSP